MSAAESTPETTQDPPTPAGLVDEPANRHPKLPARMSTIVWGVIVTMIGAGIVTRGLGYSFDNDIALIILLAAAGLALVLTSIYSATRRR